MGIPFIAFLYFVRLGSIWDRYRTWVNAGGGGRTWWELEAAEDGRRKVEMDRRVPSIMAER